MHTVGCHPPHASTNKRSLLSRASLELASSPLYVREEEERHGGREQIGRGGLGRVRARVGVGVGVRVRVRVRVRVGEGEGEGEGYG